MNDSTRFEQASISPLEKEMKIALRAFIAESNGKPGYSVTKELEMMHAAAIAVAVENSLREGVHAKGITDTLERLLLDLHEKKGADYSAHIGRVVWEMAAKVFAQHYEGRDMENKRSGGDATSAAPATAEIAETIQGVLQAEGSGA